jgi:hypothetical protein
VVLSKTSRRFVAMIIAMIYRNPAKILMPAKDSPGFPGRLLQLLINNRLQRILFLMRPTR